jgi:hypothetical protein
MKLSRGDVVMTRFPRFKKTERGKFAVGKAS